MQGPMEGEGRRPLIVPGPSRHMLQEVNKSLNQAVRVQQQQLQYPPDNMQIKGELGIRPELSKSTPNICENKANMNNKPLTRFGYNQRAMAEIKQSLAGFQINERSGSLVRNGHDVEVTPVSQSMLRQLTHMGFDEEVATRALKLSGNKSVDHALQIIQKLAHNENKNGFAKMSGAELQTYGSRVIRKPSFEKKYRTESPVNSENSSIRSESPVIGMSGRQVDQPVPLRFIQNPNTQAILTMPVGERQTPTPPVPPRGLTLNNGRGQTPPPGQDGVTNVNRTMQQMIRRMSPVQRDNMRAPAASQSLMPVSGPIPQQWSNSPMQNRPAVTQHVSNIQNNLQPASMMIVQERGIVTNQQSAVPRIGVATGGYQPSMYGQMVSSRPQSAPLHQSLASNPYMEHPFSLQQGVMGDDHSPLSSHSSSPGLVGQEYLGMMSQGQFTPKPVAVQAWSAKHPQICMHQAKSREVQKPVLQTATAPISPPLQVLREQGEGGMEQQDLPNYVSSVQAQVNTPVQKPARMSRNNNQQPMQIELSSYQNSHLNNGYAQNVNALPPGGQLQGYGQGQGQGHPGRTIQIHIQNQGPGNVQVHQSLGPSMSGFNNNVGYTPSSTPRSESPIPRTFNQSPMSVISTTSTPSTNSDMPEKPPPPYPGKIFIPHGSSLPGLGLRPDPSKYMQPVAEELIDTYSNSDAQSCDSVPLELGRDMDDCSSEKHETETHHCTSPKPERSRDAAQRDMLRQETNIKHFSSQACKFYMEQHFENLIKSCKERDKRRMQLEREMDKIRLSEEARVEMRKMLHQKESNYIRLKRAKIDKTMFHKITTLGIGAFGEVALVSKKDSGQLLAMKTLRKKDVYQRNQVAHVKAERDILAEADNAWVVKLYYSFQDDEHLYFVMDYIPGGDMMSLLIKFGIFEEPLARFYIAELVLAIDSVHKMGFIHRDIKPDNILIDKDGHIKLTDFGLCTGFRWTHSSKIYQNKGNHAKQDSMEPDESWGDIFRLMDKEHFNKPLMRRKLHHPRSLAHSLVGTPNYIAPEVLLRSGYTACCDWWSVGVILYEMLVGQPPFLANTPGETQHKVINYGNTLQIPPLAKLSSSAIDMIRRLCTGPEDRLGRNGAEEIKQHAFFSRIKDFEQLRQQPALYKPKIKNPTDTSNFDPVDPEKLHPSGSSDTMKKDSSQENGKNPEHAFYEFTFRRFFDDGGNAYAQRIEDPESNSPVYV